MRTQSNILPNGQARAVLKNKFFQGGGSQPNEGKGFQSWRPRIQSNPGGGQDVFFSRKFNSVQEVFSDPKVLSAPKVSSGISLQKQVEKAIAKVQQGLTPDLLNKMWRAKNEASGNPLVGHCYVAAEALFHLLGGKKAGWQSMMLNHTAWPQGCDPGETHWFLRHTSGLIGDPTAGQYEGQPIAYSLGIPCGFLTKAPSQRAQRVLETIQKAEDDA
ncbi:MAG: hypothetical protein K2X66_03910 [Cyanobacteria bacterium]|nr:hypothetical protein [Cyanobacteriota bacterium]